MVSPGPAGPGPGPARPRIEHYLVGSSETTVLVRVAGQLGAEPDVSVRVVAGTRRQPSVLAVAMPAERAEQLRREYPDQLVVESDEPLEPYGVRDRP
ncbi:hypothetical protein GCM10018793_37420 [Streptomyces sulfonofaciens]|uniref:Uncharacterized protein n=1 Tax=Streptomyces sulfonofaciens TaxID=68272 RepID=A0A919L2H6_9ACTN|nr:hypothetical protein [Streptomyces sulfonofaciens]GHH80979.1 hypothetical protein GCM10018793_37420 [Streptomyces sulfonofaciens]